MRRTPACIDQVILDNYSLLGPDATAALLQGHSVSWVRQRAHRLGVSKKVNKLTPIKVGDSFGALTVQERVSKKSKGSSKIFWRCLCACSKEALVNSTHLHRGTQSCGCLKALLIAEKKRKSAGYSTMTQLLKGYQAGAKKRGLSWGLTREQFHNLTQEPCHYCGNPPSRKRVLVSGDELLWNGVDRVANAVGYLTANCVSCCGTCNFAKGTLSTQDFAQWAVRLAAHLKEHREDLFYK